MDVKSVRIMLPLLLIALLCNPSFGTTLTVNQTPGAAMYTNIQDAMIAADGYAPYDPCDPLGSHDQITILVKDSANYVMGATQSMPALLFPADQNNLILAADVNCVPIMTLSGTDPCTAYIKMRSPGQIIRGFTINLTEANVGAAGGLAGTDSNSACIMATGGGTTVQDCIITGPALNDATAGYVMGLTAIANITSCDISGFRMGIVCDLNSVAGVGFPYVITNCQIHNNHKRGVLFGSCDANMIHSDIYANGNLSAPPVGGDNSSNIMCDGNEPSTIGRARVTITDCNILTSYAGRSINVETTGTVSINNCKLVQDPMSSYSGAGTAFDNILLYGGTLNLTGCLVDTHNGESCINDNAGGAYTGAIVNVNHCTFIDNPYNTQWGLFTLGVNSVINIKNSIITGTAGSFRNAYGLYQGVGTINTSYNNVYCSAPYAGPGPAKGTGDLNIKPQWIQTTDDANTTTYFVLQPYSPVAAAGQGGTYMGWKGGLPGYERWPVDVTQPKGVNFKDFATFAASMGVDGRFPVDFNSLVATDGTATMEAFYGTGTPGQPPYGSNPYLLGYRSAADTNNIFWVTTYAGAAGSAGYSQGTQAWSRATGGTVTAYGSQLTLVTPAGNDANSGMGGTKNMRWDYSLNPHAVGNGDPCYVTFTEIMYTLPNASKGGIDLKKYNTLRVMMKRAAGNTPTIDAFMYCRFLMARGGTTAAKPDKYDIVRTITGGDPAVNPGQWYAWQINLSAFDPNSGWINGSTYANWSGIGSFIFGVQTQPKGPYDAEGTGSFDVDTIQLSNPACNVKPAMDFNDDCRVTLADVREFAYYWLMGE